MKFIFLDIAHLEYKRNMSIRKWMYEEVKITSSRCCADFEGTFVTSKPRASIFERSSTSSWLVNASTCTIQVTEINPIGKHCTSKRNSKRVIPCKDILLVSNCVDGIIPSFFNKNCDVHLVTGSLSCYQNLKSH